MNTLKNKISFSIFRATIVLHFFIFGALAVQFSGCISKEEEANTAQAAITTGLLAANQSQNIAAALPTPGLLPLTCTALNLQASFSLYPTPVNTGNASTYNPFPTVGSGNSCYTVTFAKVAISYSVKVQNVATGAYLVGGTGQGTTAFSNITNSTTSNVNTCMYRQANIAPWTLLRFIVTAYGDEGTVTCEILASSGDTGVDGIATGSGGGLAVIIGDFGTFPIPNTSPVLTYPVARTPTTVAAAKAMPLSVFFPHTPEYFGTNSTYYLSVPFYKATSFINPLNPAQILTVPTSTPASDYTREQGLFTAMTSPNNRSYTDPNSTITIKLFRVPPSYASSFSTVTPACLPIAVASSNVPIEIKVLASTLKGADAPQQLVGYIKTLLNQPTLYTLANDPNLNRYALAYVSLY